MSDPAVETAQRALSHIPTLKGIDFEILALVAVREALAPIRELHSPYWMNCINACCSGEECKHRTRSCEAGCDEYVNDNHDCWPCATARLVYSADELGGGEAMMIYRLPAIDWVDNRTWICRTCGATGLVGAEHPNRCLDDGACECVCELCSAGEHCDRACCATPGGDS